MSHRHLTPTVSPRTGGVSKCKEYSGQSYPSEAVSGPAGVAVARRTECPRRAVGSDRRTSTAFAL